MFPRPIGLVVKKFVHPWMRELKEHFKGSAATGALLPHAWVAIGRGMRANAGRRGFGWESTRVYERVRADGL